MNKSQYESYWKSRKPEQGYTHVHGQNGWTAKPLPRNSFPINWGQLVAWGAVWTVILGGMLVAAIGYDNAVAIVNFVFGR